MEFTFGIITNGDNYERIERIINSIIKQQIPNYEIVIIGGLNSFEKYLNIVHIPFDDNQKNGWISKKKNLITQNSKFENIVFLHDYIILGENWYHGQLQSGNIFDVRMDKIINLDGSRYRDWCIWPHNYKFDNMSGYWGKFIDNLMGMNSLIPYEISYLSKYMYISGSYWICKKNIMEEFPLNESLVWGEGEDVDWSIRVRRNYKFQMNINSEVHIIKEGKNRVYNTPDENIIQILNKIRSFIE